LSVGTIQGLRYSIVMARDYELMKKWYSDSLGLEVADRDDEGGWVTFRFLDGGAELAVHTIPPKGEEVAKATSIVPCMEVGDIHEAVKELKERGVEFVREVHEATGWKPSKQLYQRAAGV
jgi:catechol 2,3-dioxygenase-like lactoylglutathione lyase family enzyme